MDYSSSYPSYTNSATSTGSLIGGIVWTVIWLAVAIASIIGTWKVFTKAGRPGWAAIIPIYNLYVILKIVGRPGWWLLLYLIPIVNIVISIIVALDLAKAFGKSSVYGILLLWLLSFVGYIILGFSDAKYVGPTGGSTPSVPERPQSAEPATPAASA